MSAGRIGPYIAFDITRDEPDYAVELCLKELAIWAIDHGITTDDLQALLAEAIDNLEGGT